MQNSVSIQPNITDSMPQYISKAIPLFS